MRGIYIIVISTFCYSCSFGQGTILSYEEYIDIVQKNHPLVIQAKLLDEKSDAYKLKAKGELDPTIGGAYYQKSFDDKNYYRQFDGKLKIPTWYGIDFEAGYEYNDGDFLNEEGTLPVNGLLNAGISVPLGRGLFFDERRRVIEEAKLIAEENTLKQKEIYNKLMFSANKAYVNWQVQYNNILVFNRARDISFETFNNTKSAFEVGDKTAVDTLEYKLYLDSRTADILKAEQDYYIATQELNLQLWDDGVVPLELEDDVLPESINTELWSETIDLASLEYQEAVSQVTQVRQLDIEGDRLHLDKRLFKENLKPTIDVKFNPLLRINDNNRFLAYTTDDFKLGAALYYPILNRKTKGELKLIDIEQQQLQLDQKNLLQDLRLYAAALYNNLISLEEQRSLAAQNEITAAQLLEAEYIKFDIGESSLFLLNAREQAKLGYELKKLKTIKEILYNKAEFMFVLQTY